MVGSGGVRGLGARFRGFRSKGFGFAARRHQPRGRGGGGGGKFQTFGLQGGGLGGGYLS